MDRKLCECPLQGATSLPRLRSRGWYEKDDEDADPKTDEMREERRGGEDEEGEETVPEPMPYTAARHPQDASRAQTTLMRWHSGAQGPGQSMRQGGLSMMIGCL